MAYVSINKDDGSVLELTKREAWQVCLKCNKIDDAQFALSEIEAILKNLEGEIARPEEPEQLAALAADAALYMRDELDNSELWERALETGLRRLVELDPKWSNLKL